MPSSSPSIDSLLTEQQLSERWAIAPATLRNGRSLGTGAVPYIKIGRHVRYRLADVLAYEESRIVKVGRAAGRGAA